MVFSELSPGNIFYLPADPLKEICVKLSDELFITTKHDVGRKLLYDLDKIRVSENASDVHEVVVLDPYSLM